jgi:hypothetical protein
MQVRVVQARNNRVLRQVNDFRPVATMRERVVVASDGNEFAVADCNSVNSGLFRIQRRDAAADEYQIGGQILVPSIRCR